MIRHRSPTPRPARALASGALGRAAVATSIAVTLAFSSCGGSSEAPFAGQPQGEDGAPLTTTAPGEPAIATPPVASSPTTPNATTPTTPGESTPPASPVPATTAPANPPADNPSPAGTVPDAATKAGKRPRSLSQRIAADTTAKLNVRTMVSIIEGCHSGRDTYKACNTHKELGSPTLLGLTIGKKRGEVQISATDNGFRITGHSMSGAKFTVARGPKGDRFKCISGRMPGACPADRTWSF